MGMSRGWSNVRSGMSRELLTSAGPESMNRGRSMSSLGISFSMVKKAIDSKLRVPILGQLALCVLMRLTQCGRIST